MDYAAALKTSSAGRYAKADGFNALLNSLQRYLPPEDLPAVIQAYLHAAERHGHQRRRSGEPYITHPVAAAQILADLHLDASTIMAALLHDVVEDTTSTVAEIRDQFGDDVALLVDGVSKLDKMRFDSAADAQAESFRKMLLAMAEDLRVILVKLADRVHNMRTIDAMPLPKRRQIARETLEIYAPIANRLGIYTLKNELEDLGFRARHPTRYRVLSQQLRKMGNRQRGAFRRIESRIGSELRRAGIPYRIVSRHKNIFSAYRKMQRKRAHLSEIVDLFGMRIVVTEVDHCYRVLGLVHQLYKPMPGRFKDYIAIPRVNGYQSLHTTLFGTRGIPLEIQIRTEEMNRVAEQGIAANWLYKAADKHTNAPEERARQWLAGLIESHSASDSQEFIETVRVDLFPDTVYVFTPKGDILRLPRGATAIDFAYAVHTDVGDRCREARIDRRAVPLRTMLNSGDTVEIITARDGQPNPAWLDHVVTAKARNAIRARLRHLRQSEARKLGQKLLAEALLQYSLSLRKIRRDALQAALQELEVPDIETLHEKIGLGEMHVSFAARQLSGVVSEEAEDSGDLRKPLVIGDGDGTIVTYARCCLPIPGDDVVGFISSGRGIVVHKRGCRNLAEYRHHPSRWIPVSWKQKSKKQFLTEIQIRTMDRVGVLAEIAGAISSLESNIDFVQVDTDADAAVQSFRLTVRDRAHLAQIIRRIRMISGVVKVTRTGH